MLDYYSYLPVSFDSWILFVYVSGDGIDDKV